MIDLSIIILNFNTKELTSDCVSSILKNTEGINYEIILIDNASTDGSVKSLEKLKNSKVKFVKNDQNLGFTKGNNQGVALSKGKYVLFLNSDTLISDNVLGDMVKWMDKNPRVGVSTCALKNKDGSLQATGGFFPTLLSVFSWMTIQDLPFVDKLIKPFHPMKEKSLDKNYQFYKKEHEFDWVTGAFLLTRREVVDKIGGFDEEYFMYGDDVDFCFRAKEKGWKVYFLPTWSITHYGGASSTREFPLLSEYKGIKIFYKKHYPIWKYPIVRLFLKIGALGRMVLFGILEGGQTARIYAKAFIEA